MMHALQLDGRSVGAKGAEDAGDVDQPLQQPGREVVTARDDLHPERPAREARAHVLQVVRPDEPGFVGEDVEPGLAQPPDRARLAAVAPGEHHHVPAPIVHQT